MKTAVNEKCELAIELVEETITSLEGIGFPFEIIANLDLVIDLLADINRFYIESDDATEIDKQGMFVH